MELIAISCPLAVADESIIINSLFQSGLKYFHIRKAENNVKAVRELILGIKPEFYHRISLHQFHEIAADFGIKRLHYTESARKQLSNQLIKSQLEGGFVLSTSVHALTILPEMPHFDYVFYGPVFNSISKIGYLSKLPSDFKLDKPNRKPKVIALGGVELSGLEKIRSIGFDGAAVLGTLWNEPVKAVERFIQLKDKLAG